MSGGGALSPGTLLRSPCLVWFDERGESSENGTEEGVKECRSKEEVRNITQPKLIYSNKSDCECTHSP